MLERVWLNCENARVIFYQMSSVRMILTPMGNLAAHIFLSNSIIGQINKTEHIGFLFIEGQDFTGGKKPRIYSLGSLFVITDFHFKEAISHSLLITSKGKTDCKETPMLSEYQYFIILSKREKRFILSLIWVSGVIVPHPSPSPVCFP